MSPVPVRSASSRWRRGRSSAAAPGSSSSAAGGRCARAMRRGMQPRANIQLLSVHAAVKSRKRSSAPGRVEGRARRIKDLHARLRGHEAAALADTAADPDRRARARGLGPDRPEDHRVSICEREGYTAVLFGAPAPSAVVVARGAGGVDRCRRRVKKLTEKFGGKGGGRPDLAQGGGSSGGSGGDRSARAAVTAALKGWTVIAACSASRRQARFARDVLVLVAPARRSAGRAG